MPLSDAQFNLHINEFVKWAITEFPGHIQWVPFVVRDVGRQGKNKPYVKLTVPDDWVKNIKGDPKLFEHYLSVQIPGELLPQWNKLKAEAAMLESMPESQRALFQPPGVSVSPANDGAIEDAHQDIDLPEGHS